jgi:hypothetical protein
LELLGLIFQKHTGRVFRLQFDEFQIVSSSHDDTILIWDFLNFEQPEGPEGSNAAQEGEDGNFGAKQSPRHWYDVA